MRLLKIFRDLVVNAALRLSRKQIALHNTCTTVEMRAWVVTWNCTVVGCYTSAVDAQVVGRALDARGCHGSTVAEVRMNTETTTGQALLADPG